MSSERKNTGLRVALASYDVHQLRVWHQYIAEQSAEILCSESGTRKNVGKRASRILLNQLDGSREKGAAEQTAKWIDQWSQKNGKETVTIAASCYLYTKD